MAMSNAERQRAYRERQLQDVEGGGERLNTILSVQAKAQLERLARHYGCTQRAVLERLLSEAEAAAVVALPDPEAYYVTA